MNYNKHYDLLIKKSRDRSRPDIAERHHIVPSCIGGADDESNIALLTPEEHYTAHLLLAKIFPSERKLIFAAHCMTRGFNRKSNKLYGWLRRKVAKDLSENNPMRCAEMRRISSERMKRRNDREGNPMKDERTKQKFRGKNSPVARPIVCKETGQLFGCRVDAASWLSSFLGKNANAQCLTSALKNSSISAYGFHWEYA